MSTQLAQLTASLADRYRVDRELGSGGMATVYLAEDVRHRRKVALKVLHPELSAVLGGERFLKEIELTASLQHPHILPLFDSGEAGGQLFYVMPYVQGETLRGRLERESQLPIPDALRIAREVADALQYAHERGVIHRDIKPENILLQGGHALVADFGIALAVQHAGGTRMTQTGLSLGTPQYMAPEQAMGEKVIDARADIYALGAVTYEMLVGEAPFTGPNAQAIVARLLAEDPRGITAQRRAVPPAVEDATLRALEKLPADRFATATEFAAALSAEATGASRSTGRQRGLGVMRPWPLALGGVALLAAGVAVGRYAVAPRPEAEPARYLAIALPDSMRVAFNGSVETTGGQGSVTISGNGSRIAWVGTASSGVQLYVRDMGTFGAQVVPGSAGAYAPFLSDDGAHLAFYRGRELRVVTLATGEVRVLLRDIQSPLGGAFLADGSVLVTTENSAAAVVSPGGAVRRLAGSEPQTTFVGVGSPQGPAGSGAAVGFPAMVPGDRYAVTLQRGGPLMVLGVADGDRRVIRSFGSESALFGGAPKVADGRLFWRVRDVIMAAGFDVENARLTSEPTPILSGVRGDLFGAGDYDIARDGTLVFAPGGDPDVGFLAWLDRAGRVDTLALPAANYMGFDISPDGRSLLTKTVDPSGTAVIRVVELASGKSRDLEFGAAEVSQPGWSADGRAAVLSVQPRDPASARIIRVPLEGRAVVETLMVGSLPRQAIARDGRTTVFHVFSDTTANLYLGSGVDSKFYTNNGGRRFEEIIPLRGAVTPALSPDGQWIAYERFGGGLTDVFMERFPTDGRPISVSKGGGYEPIFSARGDKLFYRSGRGVMVVALPQGPTMAPGLPESYVQFDFADFLGRSYKVGNDDRLLVKLLPSTAPQSEIRVVTGLGKTR